MLRTEKSESFFKIIGSGWAYGPEYSEFRMNLASLDVYASNLTHKIGEIVAVIPTEKYEKLLAAQEQLDMLKRILND